nr:peptidyl-prolyl cis-trans isomerase CYP20-1-like [Tanacetum cinerariifolium]
SIESFYHFVKIFTISDDVAKRAKNVKDLNRRFSVIDDMANKSDKDLKEVTHKVYFDVEIARKPAACSNNLIHLFFFWTKSHMKGVIA